MAGVKLTLEVESRTKTVVDILRTPTIETAVREKKVEVFNNYDDDDLS